MANARRVFRHPDRAFSRAMAKQEKADEIYTQYSGGNATPLQALTRYAALVMEKEKLRRVIREDTKFKVFNHGYFNEALFQFLKSRKAKKPFSYALIDLDHLKKINDELGHPAGDRVISKLAGQLNKIVKQNSGIVGRFGGDEFMILAQVPAEVLALRLEGAKNEMSKFGYTFSAGIVDSRTAVVADRPTKTVANLTALADGALKGSKKSGRNKITLV